MTKGKCYMIEAIEVVCNVLGCVSFLQSQNFPLPITVQSCPRNLLTCWHRVYMALALLAHLSRTQLVGPSLQIRSLEC
jgi:hypothetical protein